MKNRVRTVFVTLLLAVAVLISIYQARPLNDGASLTDEINKYAQRGISIRLNQSLADIPEFAYANGSFQPISDAEAVRILELVELELAKYPTELIQANLSEIMLYGDLNLYGMKYGGTQLQKKLIIVSSGKGGGYSDLFIQETFHHEFSSILLRYNKFPEQEWRSYLPAEFSYLQDLQKFQQAQAIVNQGIAQGAHLSQSVSEGFVNDYGKSSFENDVNTFAELYFTNRAVLEGWAVDSPLLNGKLAILKRYLAGLGV